MKIKSSFDILYILIGIPWIFMMIATSRGFTRIKTVLLLCLSIVAFLEFICEKKRIIKKEFVYLVIFLEYYLFSLIIGVFSGYEFSVSIDFAIIQYYFITPVLVVLLSTIFLYRNYRIDFLLRSIEVICLIVLVLDLAKILSYRIGTPDIDFFNLIMIASNNTEFELAIRVSNEASFMFLLPIIIVLFFEKGIKTKRRILLGTIVILGTAYGFLSGRKMLELLIFGTVIIMLFRELISLQGKRMIHVIEFCLGGIILLVVVSKLSSTLNIENIIGQAFNTLRKGLAKDSYGVSHRAGNIEALMDLFLTSPILGHGLNSYALNSLANGITKWSYEVLYVALLAQTGILGVTLLFVSIKYILKNLIYIFKKTGDLYFLATFIGFGSFILAGGTNPMVYYIWPWVISLALIHKDFSIKE